MTNVQSKNSRWTIRKEKQDMLSEVTKVTEYFDGKRISNMRKMTQKKTQTAIEIKSSQRQEFVCDVLEGCDDVQITENEVLSLTEEENNTHSDVVKLTMEDKQNLYAIAFLGEKEEERENNSSFEKSSIHPIKRKYILELHSSQESLIEHQGSVLEVLTQILGISKKDSMEWKEKIATRNTVVNIQIHEGKVGGESPSNDQTYYCKVGLVSIRDMKTKSRLDDVSSEVKTTNTTQSMGEPKWNESFELTLGNENGLCVEVWNECTVLEKSKKKTKDNAEPKLKKTLVGQSIVELRSKKMKNILCPINSQNGKTVIGHVTLSIEVKDLLSHSDSERYSWFQELLFEANAFKRSNTLPVEPSIENVCTKMAKFLKLNEFEKTAVKWSYISDINDSPESNGKLEVDLIILNSQWDSQANKMEPLERQRLLQEIHRLYVKTLDKIKFRFPPRNENAFSQINQIFGILFKLFLFLKDRNFMAPTEEYRIHILHKIKEGVYCWYDHTDERIVNKESMQTYVNTLNTFCQHIIKFIQMLRKYYPGQSSVPKIDIAQIAIATIDPPLAGEMEMCIQKISEMEASDELIFSMFSIERKIKLLLKEKSFMKCTDVELHIDFHVEWFRQFINKWLDILKKVSVEYVDKVIKYETNLKDIGVGKENLSSSAYDIAICLFPNYCFHAKMQEYLDTGDRIHFSFQVVLLIQETLMRYIQIMGRKISQIVDGSEKNGFKLTSEICQIFNNIHFVKEYLEEVPRKLSTHSGDETDIRYLNLIKEAEECLRNEKSRVLSVILPHFDKQIKQYCKNLTTKEDVPVEDAISGLMEWLIANIQICSTQLNQAMFNELLEVLWDLLLENISIIISDKRISCNCHQQIFRAINILYDFFYNDGDGLSIEKIKKQLFKNILKNVQLEMTSSYDLMLECVREFSNANEMNFRSYGRLTFSMVYYEDRGILEANIMKVENIYNPSFTGKCKPIIKVSIIPRSLNIEVAHTKFFKFAEDMYINELLRISIPKDKFSNTVVKISLYFRDALGIRDECYSGSIHVEEKSVGHGASSLTVLVNETDNNIGSLVERNFIYPFQEDDEKVKVLRRRTDAVAQGFMKEMVQEQKKEQSLNKYQSNVNATKKFFKKN